MVWLPSGQGAGVELIVLHQLQQVVELGSAVIDGVDNTLSRGHLASGDD